MFERFSEKAVKSIILAQEESRRLGHNFVGTEQILLGLIGEKTGIAAVVLTSMGLTLEKGRTEVEKLIGRGTGDMSIEMPFTPRAKAVLEMALEVSRELGHSYIGTEHLLLGLLKEGERVLDLMDRKPNYSIAFQVLENLGADSLNIRTQVMQAQGLGEQLQLEQFSIQPYQELLKTVLPPMSNQALKVCHAIGSQIDWEQTDIAIAPKWLLWLTRLSESEIQQGLDELIRLGVIARV